MNEIIKDTLHPEKQNDVDIYPKTSLDQVEGYEEDKELLKQEINNTYAKKTDVNTSITNVENEVEVNYAKKVDVEASIANVKNEVEANYAKKVDVVNNLSNGSGQGSIKQVNVKSSSGTYYDNEASGSGSVSLGKGTKAQGNADVVIGQNTEDDTSGSFVGGINTHNKNNSNYCFVFGDNINNQYAPHSFLFGKDIENSAANVIILGNDIVNPLKNAFLIGKGLRPQDYQYLTEENTIVILGKYNKRATQGEVADGTTFILGNGTSEQFRHNAIKLSAVKGLECFVEPITDFGIVRLKELRTKLKTLFGNQSLFGDGNIDLYIHNIKFTKDNIRYAIQYTSSKNINVDSLTDLKTLITDNEPVPVMVIDSPETIIGNAFLTAQTMSIKMWKTSGIYLESLSGFTITDTITTI